MSEDRSRGKEEIGIMKSRVKDRGPLERFTLALEGIGERSLDSGGVSEQSLVEVYHPEETLKSRFIRRREISNGRGVLWERMEAGTGEVMAQGLSLRDGKLTLAQANCQAMGTAQLRC